MTLKVDKYGIVHFVPNPLTIKEKLQCLLTIIIVLGIPAIIIILFGN
jgi:hypothetical protein